MKVLTLNIYFKLPNDFEGDYNDSVEQIRYEKSCC